MKLKYLINLFFNFQLDKGMSNSKNNSLLRSYEELSRKFKKNEGDIEHIKEFVNISNSRLDAIVSITKNSHAIAADAVTAMICENNQSVNAKNSVNTTNKMSVCLRDGEIILRYITYLLITHDESILEKSCLKDLKNTYLSLGVPLENAIRVVALMRDATVIDLKTTVNLDEGGNLYLTDLIDQTKLYFEKIINLLK